MTASVVSAPAESSDGIEFSREQRRRFNTPAAHRLVRDLGLIWLQVCAGGALFTLHPTVGTWLVAVLIIGGGQHGLAMVAHEAVHWLIWPANRALNDRVGAYLFAGPVLLPYSIYRERHLAHHRLVSMADDTKSLYRRDLRGWRFVLEVVRSLVGRDYVVQVLDALRRGRNGREQPDTVEFGVRLPGDVLRMAAVQAVLFAAFLAVDPLWHGIPTYYFLLWLAPLTTTAFWFSKLRSSVEHRPLRSEAGDGSVYYMGTEAPLLRSVRASRLERLFLSKINFHYHCEHHLWPWISYQYLPEASAMLWHGRVGRVEVRNKTARIAESYVTMLSRFCRGR